MQRILAVFLLLCLVVLGCGRTEPNAEPPAKQVAQTPESPPSQPSAGTASAVSEIVEVGDFVIGKPVRHKNLTVFPVASKTPKEEDRYITLSEGLKAGTVEISEIGRPAGANSPAQTGGGMFSVRSETDETLNRQGGKPDAQANSSNGDVDFNPFAGPTQDGAGEQTQVSPDTVAPQVADENESDDVLSDDPFGADVNHLVIINRSGKPLYLMPGEIIYGGQQDRAIGEEMIVPGDGKPVTIKVYCVEHGRWAFRDEAQTSRDIAGLADSTGQTLDETSRQKLADEARKGKFVAQAGSLSKGGRVAVQDEKGQGAVWEEVGELNASSGVDTESDAFTANYTSPEMQKQLDDYRLTLETPIAEQKQVVGAIIAINGKVEAVDVFQSTPLFRKLWPVLLKSYALDAAVCAKEPSADAVCTLQDAKEFIDLAMKADVAKTSQAPGGLVVTKRDSNRVMSFSTTDWSATESGDAAAGSGMGGFGGAVHSSGFRK